MHVLRLCSSLLCRGFNLLTMGIIAAGFSGVNCMKSLPMSEDFQCLTLLTQLHHPTSPWGHVLQHSSLRLLRQKLLVLVEMTALALIAVSLQASVLVWCFWWGHLLCENEGPSCGMHHLPGCAAQMWR